MREGQKSVNGEQQPKADVCLSHNLHLTSFPARNAGNSFNSDYEFCSGEAFTMKISTVREERHKFSVDKKNQLDVTFCILYFSSNSCSTCFGKPCAHHQELTTA